MNNFELLSYAMQNQNDALFGDEIKISNRDYTNNELVEFSIKLIGLDFLKKDYLSDILNMDLILDLRNKISDKWCSTYDRGVIAHCDLCLSFIDFICGNKRKIIDFIFYLSNIYASNKLGCIEKPTIQIKNRFHSLSYEFRKELIRFI